MSTKKKQDVTTMFDAGISDSNAADAMMNSADFIVSKTSVPQKSMPEPTIDPKAVHEISKQVVRGKIPMKITAGTEQVLPQNVSSHSINQGGPALHGNQVHLKIDLERMKVTEDKS